MKICNTQGKVFNEAKRSYIDLREGEVWCPECKGKGSHPPQPLGNYEVAEQCKTCLGLGKLDWVERAMGRKEPFDYASYFAKEIADEIDKEILDSIIKESNKNKKEATI